MSRLQKAAQAYAQHFEWHVFPLEVGGKRPLVKDWQNQASKKPNRIHQWWTQWPQANIGVACGLSRLVVVDLDVKNEYQNGIETWRDIVLEHNIDDDTAIQLTPSGGQHLVFQANGNPIRNSASKLGPGVDIRGDGGYIVLAPSVLDNGEYVWDVGAHPGKTPLAHFPAPLISILLDGNVQERIPAGAVETTIYIGQRNETLTSLGGTMRRRGMAEDAIRAALHVENKTKCDPPLPDGEVDRIAGSVSRYEPATVGLPRVFNLTDYGNAERLATEHGKTIRYCHAWKRWLYWDGVRWMVDESSEIMRRAKETARHLYAEASQTTDDDHRKSIVKWAKGSESRTKLAAMIALTESETRIPVHPDNLDSNPWALNVLNGIVDLRTGTLFDHDPSHLMTKLIKADLDTDAQCPLWLSFLDRIMESNPKLIGYLQRATGYSLTGDTREQVLFIMYGVGANGKSVFLETISNLLNDYAMRTPTQTLMTKAKGAIPNDLARLRGARLVTAVEADEDQKLAEGMVKQMTGGERLTARFLNAEWFEFTPEFKIWLATNHQPEIRGTDHAIWRRIHLIPFRVVIPDEEQDKNLSKKLQAEFPGILAWAVKGCQDWQTQGLGEPPEVIAATRRYREAMDVLAGFLDDCCAEEPHAETSVAALYKAYTNWCLTSGERAVPKRGFGLRMKERGYTQTRGSGGIRRWCGIALKETPVQTPLDIYSNF